MHKFASNVVEKCFERGNSEEREEIITELLVAPACACPPVPPITSSSFSTQTNSHLIQLLSDSPIFTLLQDQFANYVIQKIIFLTSYPTRERIIRLIIPYTPALKQYNTQSGKYIISCLVKTPVSDADLRRDLKTLADVTGNTFVSTTLSGDSTSCEECGSDGNGGLKSSMPQNKRSLTTSSSSFSSSSSMHGAPSAQSSLETKEGEGQQQQNSNRYKTHSLQDAISLFPSQRSQRVVSQNVNNSSFQNNYKNTFRSDYVHFPTQQSHTQNSPHPPVSEKMGGDNVVLSSVISQPSSSSSSSSSYYSNKEVAVSSIALPSSTHPKDTSVQPGKSGESSWSAFYFSSGDRKNCD
jgi:hypothetical protein